MATATGTARDTRFSVRGVPLAAAFLYLLLLFPVTSFLLGVNLYYPSLVVLVLLTGYAVLVVEDLEVSRSFALLLLAWAVFLLYFAISMLWSPSSAYALSKFLRLATICSLLLVAPTLLFPETDDAFRFFKLSIYASVVIAAMVIYGFLSPDVVRPWTVVGALSHLAPGRMIGFGVVVATYYVLCADRRPRRVTAGAMLVVLLVGLVASGSRGPLVAAIFSTGALVVVFLSVVRGDHRRAALFVLASSAAIASVFVLHFVLGVTIPNLDRILPLLRGDIDPSNQRRLRFIRHSVLLWLEAPLRGSGAGSYAVWVHGVDREEYPHNIFLELLSEQGVIGLLLFGAILLVAGRSIVANLREHPLAVLLLGVFGYALINASFSQDLQGNRMVYAAIGLSLSFAAATDTDGPND